MSLAGDRSVTTTDENLPSIQKVRDRVMALAPQVFHYSAELPYLYEQMGMREEWFAHLTAERTVNRRQENAFYKGGIPSYWQEWLEDTKTAPSYRRAEIFARLGRIDQAIADLNIAYELRDHQMAQLLVNPVFDPLRSDPRFQELLRRLKFIP